MSIPKNSVLKARYEKEKHLWLLDKDPICDCCGLGTRMIDCSHIISRSDCLKHAHHVMPNGKEFYTLYYSMVNFAAHCNDFANGCHRKYEDGDVIGNDFAKIRAFIEEVAPMQVYQKFIERFNDIYMKETEHIK